MKRRALIVTLILLLSLIPAWAIKPAVSASPNPEGTSVQGIRIYASEDTWIDEGGYVDSRNYRLRVGTYNGKEERPYLKFNLSELPEDAVIVRAVLKLHAYSHYGDLSHNVSVYGVLNDSWSDATLRWDNQPTETTGPLNWTIISLPDGDADANFTWDVTNFVREQFESDGVVSFYLHSNLSHVDTRDYIYFNSRESRYDNYPCLEIDYYVPPVTPIREIQSNTTDGDKSAYVGREVTTAGIVTGIAHWTSRGRDLYGFFIQNGTGPWRGIFVFTYTREPKYDDGTPVSVGDKVKVTGEVAESYGLTEIDHVSSIIRAEGVPLETPEPVVLHTGEVAQEQWESVLVMVENATVTNPDLGYGEWQVDDGSGPVRVDDLMYHYSAQNGEVFNYIVGVVYYSYGEFKIEPRGEEDLSLKIPEIVSLEVPRHYVGEGLINVTVRNNYEVSTNVTLRIAVNGDVLCLENLTLGGNEIRSIPVEWSPSEPGDYTINVTLMNRDGELFDTESRDVEVHYGVGLKSHGIPKVVLVDEPVEFNFTLFNNYSAAKTVNFTVLVNGEPLYSNDSIVLESGEELRLTIPWKAPRYGNYTVNATLRYGGVIVGEVGQRVYAQYGISPTGKSTIEPTADAYSYYYKGTDFSWRNYYIYQNTRYELAVGNSSLFSMERAYMKFDLNSIPEIANVTSAKLCVYAFYVKSPMEVGVYAVDDSWSEEQKPSEPPKLGDSINVTVMERSGEWYCWNVTDYVRDEASGDRTVSVALRMTNESMDNIAWIASRENPSNRPYLNVTYSIPLKIKNFENVTVAVIGNANVSSENGTLIVELDGESYAFSTPGKNVFIDATGFNPGKPSLLAYWKTTMIGYASELVGESTYRINARQVVRTTTTRLTIDIAMEADGTAVFVIPLQGDRVTGVGVVKDGENVTLHENATDDEIGYYYITDGHLVVVLKKDPTQVVVTFESTETVESPTAISTFYSISLYYSLYLHKRTPYLEGLYANFTNLTTELKRYNVSLGNVPIDEIREGMEEYREHLSQVPEDIFNFARYRFKVYPIFRHAREAFVLYKELTERLEGWNPVLQDALRAAEESNGSVQIVVPTPSNEVSVLIDASHGQYYVEKNEISYLVNKIQNELGWQVAFNYDSPITYDLLRGYTVVVLLDPKTDYTAQEIAAIKKYVENGGGLLIAGEWYKYANVNNFNEIVGDYGITFNPDELMDNDRNSGRPYYPFIGIYNKDHPAMKFVPEDWTIYYNGETLALSGNAVWLIKAYGTAYSVDAGGNVILEKGSNPIVAAAVDLGTGRIVAYGSSRGLSDSYHFKYIASNWPFIKGVLLWLAHQE
ncbi:DNRLRE domain-containing protein [Thermococcus sp. 21S7]|uniref:DNRLRE domain-containing protein n=1 Tax=Thermococcus sp. 21S7 TaxID=1638221 RepID=UPI001F0F0148|nr:DNRLRE domain-containing protein [Thermococcus sp. 21S7]